MPAPLDDDEIDEIIETYAELENFEEAAEKLDRAEDTVRKYVAEAERNEDPRLPDIPTPMEDRGEEVVGDGEAGESPFREPDSGYVDVDLSEATPGDFLHSFFENFEIGVKEKWVRIQARRADRRNALPDKKTLVRDLLNMSSGISQSALQEAEYIADEYYAEAWNFVTNTTYNWFQEGRNGPQQGQPPHHQQHPQGHGQYQQNPGVQPYGQQQPPQGQGQNQEQRMLLEEVKSLRREVKQLKGGSQQSGRSQRTVERLRELQEEKEILEELSSGDDRLEQIEQQIMRLQQAAMNEGGDQPVPGPAQDLSMEERLLDMAKDDPNTSLKEVLNVIEERNGAEQHPDVLEKKYEKEIEKEKLKAQTDRQEKVAETLESFADRIGEGIGRAIVGGDDEGAVSSPTDTTEQATPADDEDLAVAMDGDGSAAAGQQPQQSQQTQPSDTTPSQECKHCGEEMDMSMGAPTCLNCGYGVGQCDICSYPVEIPPKGEATHGRCGECETLLERPDDGDTVECDSCGWEGEADEVRGEALQCDECGEIRPIVRPVDAGAANDRLQELMEG